MLSPVLAPSKRSGASQADSHGVEIIDRQGKTFAVEWLAHAQISHAPESAPTTLSNFVLTQSAGGDPAQTLTYIPIGRHDLFCLPLGALRSQNVVLQLAPELEPSSDVICRLRWLKGEGYRFSLGNCSCADDPRFELLPFVSWVQIDMGVADAAQAHAIGVRCQYASQSPSLYATNIAHIDELRACLKLGCDAFSGSLLGPAIKRNIEPLPSCSPRVLRHVKELLSAELDDELLTLILVCDPALILRLSILASLGTAGVTVVPKTLMELVLALPRSTLSAWVDYWLGESTDSTDAHSCDWSIGALQKARFMESLSIELQGLSPLIQQRAFMHGLVRYFQDTLPTRLKSCSDAPLLHMVLDSICSKYSQLFGHPNTPANSLSVGGVVSHDATNLSLAASHDMQFIHELYGKAMHWGHEMYTENEIQQGAEHVYM